MTLHESWDAPLPDGFSQTISNTDVIVYFGRVMSVGRSIFDKDAPQRGKQNNVRHDGSAQSVADALVEAKRQAWAWHDNGGRAKHEEAVRPMRAYFRRLKGETK